MNFFTIIRRIVLPFTLAMGCAAPAAGQTPVVTPTTARGFYNAGTALLAQKKFAEAETMFQSALAVQEARIQPQALYNLGESRFAEGVEILKKGPESQSVLAQGQAVSAMSERVLKQGRRALAENDPAQMIGSYFAGRGMRKELGVTEKAFQKALETYGTTLRKWQRAADDFKSAAELNPADTNADYNAKLVEQHIARLMDRLRELQRMAGRLGDEHHQLNQMLSQLKGRVPQLNAPPGEGGDGDEDDDGNGGIQPDSLAGQRENPSREGRQMQLPLSPEVAAQLLDGLSLDGTRRLSMLDTNTARLKDKTRRTW